MTAPDAAGAPDPKPRILLVEDEPLIRLVIADELREAGFSVVECATADEGLETLRGGLAFDLLLSDVLTPGRIDGVALASAARLERPDLPIVLLSGHAPDIAPSGAAVFLRKPVPLATLLGVVERLLGLGRSAE